MPFRQFQYSEGAKASKAAVIAVVIGSGSANIQTAVDDMHHACCADVKRKYRQHALEHHSDKHGCPENFYKLTNAKEKALKTCNPCSHNRDKKHTHTKHRQRPTTTSSKKTAKKRRKAQRRQEKKSKQKQKNKEEDHYQTQVSATSLAMAVGGLVVAGGGPEKNKKKKTLRQTSTGRIR
tara:strand:+ start:6516 stop:7052 length:537 start_codon:yes stop_codon:yes gene_type:complete